MGLHVPIVGGWTTPSQGNRILYVTTKTHCGQINELKKFFLRNGVPFKKNYCVGTGIDRLVEHNRKPTYTVSGYGKGVISREKDLCYAVLSSSVVSGLLVTP